MLGCNYVLSTFLKPLAWLGDFREMYNISLKGTALSGDLSKIDAVTGSSSYKSEIWKVKMTFPLSIKKKSFTIKNSGRHSSNHQYELVWRQISWHITWENLIVVKIFWYANNYYGPLKARGWRKKFQKAYFLTKCDNLLLQRVTAFLLHSATKSLCKGRQVLQSATIFIHSATGITECDDYYKVRQNRVSYFGRTTTKDDFPMDVTLHSPKEKEKKLIATNMILFLSKQTWIQRVNQSLSRWRASALVTPRENLRHYGELGQSHA